jgi:KTSC domain-containing protein
MRRTPSVPIVMISIIATVSGLTVTTAAQPAKIVSHIPRQSVASSALAAAGYSKRLHVMEIEFSNGAIYRYLDVPGDVYRDFLQAESKTRYYDWNIKGHYRSLRVRAAEQQIARK